MSAPRDVIGRKAGASPWWAWLLLAAFLGAAVWLVIEHPVAGAIGVGLFALGVLSARYRQLGERIDEAFRRYLVLLAWLVAIAGPILVVRLLSDAVESLPLILRCLLLAAWVVAYLVIVRALSTDARRKRLWETLRPVGAWAPFVFAFVVAVMAIVLFATLAFVLADEDMISFGTDEAAAVIAEPADALDFFSWQLLDAVPGLDVTDTLKWEQPLGYDDAGVGVLILLFKLLAVIPIIAAFVSFWRWRRSEHDAADVSG